MIASKPFEVSRYRAFAQATYYARRIGFNHLPGFERAVEVLDRSFFPELHAAATPLVLRLRGNLLVVPPEFLSHYARGHFERLTTRMFEREVTEGSCVVDVGANIGYYSVLAARLVGVSGTVHAIEPYSESLTLLRRNLELNDFTNAIVHPVAASSGNEVREFNVTGSIDSNSFYSHPLTETRSKVSVLAAPIDGLVREQVRLYKIDVEGAEIEVLEGMHESMARSPGAAVIVEWNPACMRRANREPTALVEILKTLGLNDLCVIDDRDNVCREVDEVAQWISKDDQGRHFNLFGHLPGRPEVGCRYSRTQG
jgi:FkbM family methyltransferase